MKKYYYLMIASLISGINLLTAQTTPAIKGDDAKSLPAIINNKSAALCLPSVPSICMVTSDSLSLHNIVYWDKTLTLDADSFVVYREVTANNYARIGAVSKDSLSIFTDTTQSVGGPQGGNPNMGSYRYKLQVRDSCGNYGALSLYHTSVYLVDNFTGTFTVNTYDIEGQVTPVTQFILMRDNGNTGNYQLVTSVAGTQTILSDINYGTYQMTANWRVDAIGFNCNPSLRLSEGAQSLIIKSRSNVRNNRTLKAGFIRDSGLKIGPNPANGELHISLSESKGCQVEIINVFGEVVTDIPHANAENKVNTEGMRSGVYFVKVSIRNEHLVKKVIVAH